MFSNSKSMGTKDTPAKGGAIFDPWVMYGRRFFKHSHHKPMSDNDAPGAGSVWTLRIWLAGFLNRNIQHTKY